MTDVNHELFVKVFAQIEKHPKLWNQSDFGEPCGTAMCFGGWACLLSDLKGGDYERYGYVSSDAAAVLGIPDNFGATDDHMFHGDNTLDDLYRISAEHMGIDETVLRDKVRAEVES